MIEVIAPNTAGMTPKRRLPSKLSICEEANVTNTNDVAAIREIIEERAKAVNAGDIDTLVADLAEDVVSSGVVDPLRRDGKASSRKRAAESIAAYNRPPTSENRDVRITADGDVAFSHMLSRVTGSLKAGGEIDMWFRTTLGFRRTGGRWFIVHEHSSAPFDPASGKASLGLKP